MRDRSHENYLILAGLAGVLGAMAACKPAPAQRPAPEVSVQTVHPERAVLTTELPGRTSAYLVAEIRPQVNGLIQKRLFQEGSDVKAGSVLYQLDPAPYQAALDQARPRDGGRGGSAGGPVPGRTVQGPREIHAVGEQDGEEAAGRLPEGPGQPRGREGRPWRAPGSTWPTPPSRRPSPAASACPRVTVGRPGDGLPARGPAHGPAAGSHLRGRHPVQLRPAQVCSAAWRAAT